MKFKINNRKWEIIEISQEEIKTIQNNRKANKDEETKSIALRYYGITYCDWQKIYIDKDLSEGIKKATLIHELTHCFIANYITHQDKQYDEEDVCDITSNAFEIIESIINKYFKLEENKCKSK